MAWGTIPGTGDLLQKSGDTHRVGTTRVDTITGFTDGDDVHIKGDDVSISPLNFIWTIPRRDGNGSSWRKDRRPPTMSDLMDIPSSELTDGDMADLQGFYSVGDGGGGELYWDASADKANHNGGTIIDPDHSVTPGNSGWWASENTGSGCWVRPHDNTLNVLWFGPVGDSVSDDRPALQGAFDALPNKGTMILPPQHIFELQDDANGDAYVEVIDKSLTVIANGATIKLGPETGYTGFYIHSSAGNADDLEFIHWFGGTLWGNKNEQNFTDNENDGTTTTYGTGTFDPLDLGNTGLLGIRNAKSARVDNATVFENVSDGIVFVNNEHSLAEGVFGLDGASPQPDGHPQTIKWRPTQDGLSATYNNCKVVNSNIMGSGQDASNRANSKLIVSNCVSEENYQSAFYDERASSHLYIDNCYFYNSFEPLHQLVKGIANDTFLISNCYLEGGIVESGRSLSLNTHAIASNCVHKNNKDAGAASFEKFFKVVNCHIENSAQFAVYSEYMEGCYVDQSASGNRGWRGLGDPKIENCTLVGGSSSVGAVNPIHVVGCEFYDWGNAIFISGDFKYIFDSCRLYNLQGAGIRFISSHPAIINVSNCVFEDFGKDTTADSDRRVGIGENNGGFASLVVTGCTFRRTDNTVDMCVRSINIGGASTTDYAIVIGCVEIEMQNQRSVSVGTKIEKDNIVNGTIE